MYFSVKRLYLNLTKLVVNCEKLCYLSGRARDLDAFFLPQSRYYRDIEIIKFEQMVGYSL